MCDCGIDMTNGSYATLNNTIGIGDPVPFGNNNYGSGDKFTANKKKSKNTDNNHVPFDLSMKPLIVMANKK